MIREILAGSFSHSKVEVEVQLLDPNYMGEKFLPLPEARAGCTCSDHLTLPELTVSELFFF